MNINISKLQQIQDKEIYQIPNNLISKIDDVKFILNNNNHPLNQKGEDPSWHIQNRSLYSTLKLTETKKTDRLILVTLEYDNEHIYLFSIVKNEINQNKIRFMFFPSTNTLNHRPNGIDGNLVKKEDHITIDLINNDFHNCHYTNYKDEKLVCYKKLSRINDGIFVFYLSTKEKEYVYEKTISNAYTTKNSKEAIENKLLSNILKNGIDDICLKPIMKDKILCGTISIEFFLYKIPETNNSFYFKDYKFSIKLNLLSENSPSKIQFNNIVENPSDHKNKYNHIVFFK